MSNKTEEIKLTEEQLSELEQLQNPDSEWASKYAWDEEFQRHILSMMLNDREFLVQCDPLIEPGYFTNEVHQLTARLLKEHFKKHRVLPEPFFMTQEVQDNISRKPEKIQNHYHTELNAVYHYYKPGVSSRAAMRDKVTNFAKVQSMKEAFIKCLEMVKKEPENQDVWMSVYKILQHAMSIDYNFDAGLEYFLDFRARYQRAMQAKKDGQVFTTGYKSIDAGMLAGGPMRGELYAVMGMPGSGKTWRKGTRVLMFNGSTKKVEHVKVGDLLMGPDSTPRKVLHTHSLIDKVFEIKPIKGDSYFVNKKHILSLKNSHRQGAHRNDRPTNRRLNPPLSNHPSRMGKTNIYNISVEDWFKQSKHFKTKMKGWRTGVNWPTKEVTIDPYILGVWLGDGRSSCPEIINFDQLWQQLLHYNLPNNKHIPFDYKINDRKTRLEILAGLLDTDGHQSGNGYDFISKSKVLSEDVTFLARSLGLAAYYKPCKKKSQNGTEGTYYRVSISGNCDEIPVRIPYKKCSPRKQVKDVLLTGIEVIEHNKYDEFYGFEVDGDHLLMLDDFTVQHNSLTLVHTATENLIRDRKVLYISTEMAEDKIAQRFDAQLFSSAYDNFSINTMLSHQEEIFDEVDNLIETNEWTEDTNRLVIKQFPAGVLDIPMLRSYYQQLTMRGFKPDIVIIDYVGEMRDHPKMPTHESRFLIIRDLRGFAVEEDICCFTALQPNRSGREVQKVTEIDDDNLGDSYAQSRPLDGLYSINQTNDQKECGVGRIFVIKLRDGKSRYRFHVDYNHKTLKITEITAEEYMLRWQEYKHNKQEHTITNTMDGEAADIRKMEQALKKQGLKENTIE